MELISQPSLLPLDIQIYEHLIPLFSRGLGIYYHNDYYVARRPLYKSPYVKFERFIYDVISLFGVNLLYIEIQTLEALMRTLFKNVSYNFDGKVQFRCLEDVDPAFTDEKYMEAVFKRMQGESEDVDKEKQRQNEMQKRIDTSLAKVNKNNQQEEEVNLFQGLMSGNDNVLEIKQKKAAEKKEKIRKLNQEKMRIHPLALPF